ncbi:conjugal transfer protein TraR [Pseudoalteromonas sp. MMG010]|uniref:TraR/DksA C4-type zinc finger protein n=1 Tax=Pseudoalteromonas sp. MMG010 TaxID=2822685 RepID=UPI001B3A7B28|nr:TraR/DksA C4-type zinc finger protein [Pseudoalteromonas sp. MMG010]MBQ4833255.1 conjugal transfer protein TraR [Pseudoalteromonas sp. MMG010]
MALLAQSVHSSQQSLLIKLDNINHSEWLDYAALHLGSEYQGYIKRLMQLEAAISQHEIGLYGVCADCEQPIEQSRLNIDLACQRCIKCEEKYAQ